MEVQKKETKKIKFEEKNKILSAQRPKKNNIVYCATKKSGSSSDEF